MAMSPRLLRPLARFQAPPAGTPASLLLNFNGSNGSTALTDSSPSGLTVTANEGAAISTAQSKFGGASVNLGGLKYVSVSPPSGFALGLETWTVEAWVYMLSLSPYSCFLEIGNHASATGIVFALGSSVGTVAYSGGFYGTGAAVSLDQWHHVAFSFDGSQLRLFLDGIQQWDVPFSNDLSDDTTISMGHPLGLSGGAPPTESGTDYYFDGYIDDLRIVKGLAIYDGDFVPPSAALTANATPYTTYKPYGTLLFSACDGIDLVGTYADGDGGRYTEVISAGACE